MAEISDGTGLAECGAVIPPSAGVISGVDPRSGKTFVNQVLLGFTEGAGAPSADAWQTIGHVGNAGLSFLDSVELDELRQPLWVSERRFLPNTEGAGRFKGAHSLLVEFGPVNCELTVAYGSDGSVNGPRGVRGGLTGAHAGHAKRHRDGRVEVLPAFAQVQLLEGERIVSYSCGGGGYGHPFERDPLQVARDVSEHWVDRTRAREVYGVELLEDGGVDTEKTQCLRAPAADAASTARPPRSG